MLTPDSVPNLILAVCLAALANLSVDRLISQDEVAGLVRGRSHRSVRVWAIWLGLLAMGLTQLPASSLAVALFCVSAGMDLETRRVPPDWYVYGSTLAGIGAAAWPYGGAGLVSAMSTQAICYGLTVLGVRYFGMVSGGDIKLAMQFGAACVTFQTLSVAALVMALAMALALVASFSSRVLRTQSVTVAAAQTATLRLALGPFMWLGLIGALIVEHAGIVSLI